MKTLVLCDDVWHPARTVRAGLAGLEDAGFTFDWIENADDWQPESLQAYPLVVLSKSNNTSSADPAPWMTPAVESAFAEYLRGGGGLAAVHSGTADYEMTPVFRSLLGGVFARHPDQCPVTVSPVRGHPLPDGLAPFAIRDEHYFMTMDDPQVEVFLTTSSEHGIQPGGWTRTEGTGRVAVLTPGHNLDVWLHPSFRAILLRTMLWCGGAA